MYTVLQIVVIASI